MLERVDTAAIKDAEKAPQIRGLVLFVVDEYDNALVFQNHKTKQKTQKISGQLTVPAETLELNERFNANLLPRTILEEVGQIKDPKPIQRGIIRMDTPDFNLGILCVEIPTTRDQVMIDPLDFQEVSTPRWIPLVDIDDRTMRVGAWDVPVFRSPLPELASNVLNARKKRPFPQFQKVKSELPRELFEYLERNPGPVHPVK